MPAVKNTLVNHNGHGHLTVGHENEETYVGKPLVWNFFFAVRALFWNVGTLLWHWNSNNFFFNMSKEAYISKKVEKYKSCANQQSKSLTARAIHNGVKLTSAEALFESGFRWGLAGRYLAPASVPLANGGSHGQVGSPAQMLQAEALRGSETIVALEYRIVINSWGLFVKQDREDLVQVECNSIHISSDDT